MNGHSFYQRHLPLLVKSTGLLAGQMLDRKLTVVVKNS